MTSWDKRPPKQFDLSVRGEGAVVAGAIVLRMPEESQVFKLTDQEALSLAGSIRVLILASARCEG